MKLKCGISSSALKCWGKVIQTLASTGESDINFTVAKDLLTLYTYDSSHSVCCTCKFDKTFFFRYEVQEGNQLFCRIPSKCLLKPFKSLRFLQRCSDTCEIEFNSEINALTITIPCKGGVKVRHKLNFSVNDDTEELDFDPETLQSCIAAEPKIFLRSLANFTMSKGVSELTLNASNNKLLLKNCVNDMIKREGKVYTELTMNAVDFGQYAIVSESELSFPMREFKTFVSFAEYMKTFLSLNFQGPNEPLLATAQSDDGTYCATLLLATRSAGNQGRNSKRNTAAANSSQRVQINSSSSDRSNVIGLKTPRSSSSSVTTLTPNTSAWSSKPHTPVSTMPSRSIIPTPETTFSVTSAAKPTSHRQETTPQSKKRPSESRQSIPLVIPDEFDEPFDDDQNLAPSSPIRNEDDMSDEGEAERGRKRMRLLFPNLGQRFDPVRDLPGYTDILVECSDGEDD